MECISYDTSPIEGEQPQHAGSVWTSVTSLVRCDSFVIERVRMAEGVSQPIPYQEFVVWMVLEGSGAITYGTPSESFEFRRGDTVLLPAALTNGSVHTHEDCMWLEASYPVPSSLRDFERPDRDTLRAIGGGSDGMIQLNTPEKPGPEK